MKASDLFVKCLENEGVEYIFGVPGEENLDLLESLRQSKIKLIVTRHEQHAAFMAGTYGRLTGKAGVCLSTLGPGATNLVTGLAQAKLAGMPMVAITGQKGIRDNWQGSFQLLDVVGTFRPLTKWTTSIVSARTVPRSVRNAFKVAEDERPGPVHLELPEDVAQEQLEGQAPHRRVRLRRPVPDEKAIQLAAELVKKAKNPLMIICSGANRKRVGKQLKLFLEKTGIYAVCTQMGKGVLPEDHPQSLFGLGIHKKDYVHGAIESADLIITVGYNIVEYPPFVWNENKNKKILHLDFSPAEPDEFFNPDLEVVGDISYALWAMYEKLGQVKFENGHMAELRQVIHDKLFRAQPDECFPHKPQHIVHDVRQAMGREDIVCLDNGIYKLWFARMYQTYSDNTLLLDNALATMGAGLAQAMAAKMVFPKRRALAVVGDGGFMMNSQDLETAVRLKLDLVVLLLRDDSYGFIKWKQQGMGFPSFGMDFGNPDFVKYATAYGARGIRASKKYSVVELLEQAFAMKGPVLIDCPVDYSENEKLSRDLYQELGHLIPGT